MTRKMTTKTSDNGAYYVRLEPEEKGLHLRLGELWTYRDLVWLLTKRTFKVTYQQTILGPLWILLQPVLSSVIYMFIFGQIAAIGTAGIPQILFYFLSAAVWELVSASLISNSNTFVNNAHLFSKVYFPRVTVPISNMLVSILKFLIQLVIILILLAVYVAKGAVHPNWTYYPLLPLLFVQMSLLGMSVGILVSSLTTKYRDLQMLVSIGASLWMYATPVVYPMQELPDNLLKTIIRFNPASAPMELIRQIMLGQGEFDPAIYFGGLAVTAALFLLSLAVFNRVERTFADTV